MRAVVCGMVAAFPLGGVAFDYLQYALGLEEMGFEVFYLEDTGFASYAVNPDSGEVETQDEYGEWFLERTLASLSPSLAERWHLRDSEGRARGLSFEEIEDAVAGADLLLNVSGGCLLREGYRRCPLKVFVDTDPGWNQFVILPRWDRKSSEEKRLGFRAHDRFFTYALNFGGERCRLPNLGLSWTPTLPPVVMDLWDPSKEARPGAPWTTLMSWNNFGGAFEHGGETYGAKEPEFERVEGLPGRFADVDAPTFEVAVNGADALRERWRGKGWRVADGPEKTRAAEDFEEYVAGSRGEFSVAKNVYVDTRSGWFGVRTPCYLASGRPAVIQETGFSAWLPPGEGLLSFVDLDGAEGAVEKVESDYARHARAAREVAEERFDHRRVFERLLAEAGL